MSAISEFLTQTRIKNELTDGGFSGITARVSIVSNSRGRFALLHTTSSGYALADASNYAQAPCSAMALEDGVGDNKLVLLKGYVKNSDWSLTRGAVLYLDTYPGRFRQTAPSGPNDIVQGLGIAYSQYIVDFDPDYTTLTVGSSSPATTSTTSTLPNRTWYLAEDDTRWNSNNSTWNGTEGRWHGADGVNPELYDVGGWTSGYRPTRVRLTMRATTDTYAYFMIKDALGNNIAVSKTERILSARTLILETVLEFKGTGAQYDIDKLYCVTTTNSTNIIWSIEFDQPIPSNTTTTTTTTTAAPTWVTKSSSSYWDGSWNGSCVEWSSGMEQDVINVVGSWANSYRPTKIRFSFSRSGGDGSGDLSFTLMDEFMTEIGSYSDIMPDDGDIVSVQFNLNFSGTEDIYSLMYQVDGALMPPDSIEVCTIEFYEG